MNIKPHQPAFYRWLELLGAVVLAILGTLFLVGYDQLVPNGFASTGALSGWLNAGAGRWFCPGGFALIALLLGVDGLLGLRQIHRMYAAPLTKSPAELTNALQQALDFTAEDLHANQSGQVSQSQGAAIDQRYRRPKTSRGCLAFFWLIPIGILVLAVGAFLAVQGTGIVTALLSNPNVLLVGGVVAIVIVLFAVWQGVTARRITSDYDQLVEHKALESTEGVVRLYARPGGRYGPGYFLYINNHKFGLRKKQYDGFWSGATYRIYYMPLAWTNLVLSGELLDVPRSV